MSAVGSLKYTIVCYPWQLGEILNNMFTSSVERFHLLVFDEHELTKSICSLVNGSDPLNNSSLIIKYTFVYKQNKYTTI